MAKVECELITQDVIDVEIAEGVCHLLPEKRVEITENGKTVVVPDEGFEGIQRVEINTNTPKNITGVIGVPDGMSIAQLLYSPSAISSVTEIVDTNVGWTMDKALNTFLNLEKLQLGCSLIPSGSIGTMISSTKITKIEFTNLVTMYNQGRDKIPTFNVPNAELYFQSLVNLYAGRMYNGQLGYIAEAKAVIAPKLSNVNNGTVANSSNIKKMVFGKVETWYNHTGNEGNFQFGSNCPNLIHVELGEGSAVSISMPAWSPTNALDASRTDLIEEGSTAQNNLQQFLQNFRDYIAERLTDKGTGLTLTLSKEVRNAIHAAEDEYGIENIIITQKGWTISPAPN